MIFMSFRRSIGLAVLLALIMSGVLGQVRPMPEEELADHDARGYRVWAQAMASGPTAGQGMDVTFYSLDLNVTGGRGTLAGAVTTDAFIVGNPATSVSVDLSSAIIVDSVRLNGAPVPFARPGNTMVLTLPRSYAVGERVSWTVYYHGTPAATGFGSYTDSLRSNGTRWIYTLSEPYGAREWWPCVDHPTDKADSVAIRLTYPSGYRAVANGLLVDSTQNGNGSTTVRWIHRFAIAPYLVAINVGPFVTFSDWYRYSPVDSFRVINYVQPDLLTRRPIARAAAGLTPRMLEVFEELFGAYPFRSEGYGHVEFGWGGGMEHQTLTSLGWGAFNEGTIAHELAHQWFGDLITCTTWPDLWLNEGFATYSDALFRERYYGREALLQAMVGRSASARSAIGTLVVQDTVSIGNLFASSRVYSKGAWVLHMLRRVVGDSVFFRSLKAYASDPALRFGTASTADLSARFETESGADLTYFFDQWVFGQRYPAYTYAMGVSTQSGGSVTTVRIRQATGTSNPLYFRMPIDLRFRGVTLDTLVTVWNDTSDQTWQFTFESIPDSVEFDPGNWILKTAQKVSMTGIPGFDVPTSVELSANFPNPFNAMTWFRVGLPERSHVRLEVFDMTGRRVDVLVEREMEAGTVEIPWSTTSASGAYICRIVATGSRGQAIVTRKVTLIR